MHQVSLADHLIVLDSGRLAETGSFDDLMQRNGPTFRLVERLQTATKQSTSVTELKLEKTSSTEKLTDATNNDAIAQELASLVWVGRAAVSYMRGKAGFLI